MPMEIEADPLIKRQEPIFNYEEAFSRNLGLVTEWEQQILRSRRIAIAGMGGVGGVHLLTLARFGIGSFHITDFDQFELANFNRQVGATMDTIGRPKVEVLAERALQINPELKLKSFKQGLDDENLEEFLSGVDLYVDSLDFFVLEIRRKLYARCAELGIPVVCAAPIGMGTAYLVFMPGGMTFEEWFRIQGLGEEDQYLNWYVGLTPSRLQTASLVDPSRVDLAGRRGPSSAAGCELSAGVASVEAVKILLRRGNIRAVPYYHQFDVYKGRFVVKKLRKGNRATIQQWKIVLGRQFVKTLKRKKAAMPVDLAPQGALERILHTARWAPSGDNCQPWRFEIINDDKFIINIEENGNIYDFNNGEPTLIAAGILLETLRIAASQAGRRINWSYVGKTGLIHKIAVTLVPDASIAPDDLLNFVPLRSVNRGRLLRTPLTEPQKASLARSLGEDFTVEWRSTLAERWRTALSNARTTDIRLRSSEAFKVHQDIIDWRSDFSRSGIPAKALGIDGFTLKIMRWVLGGWRRMQTVNRLTGTGFMRLEMDLIPGIFCAAHFVIRGKTAGSAPRQAETIISSGQAIQRFWLTATKLGLALQPAFTSIIFEFYGRNRVPFTSDAGLLAKAEAFAGQLQAHEGPTADIIFRGRLGQPRRRLHLARSIRKELKDLLLPKSELHQEQIVREQPRRFEVIQG